MERNNFIKHIDDLGRIIIPKEIRKKLNLQEQDTMRFTTFRGNIIMRKCNLEEK